MRLRANALPMKADGTVDESLPADLSFKVKQVLIDGIKVDAVLEACEEGRWAILFTGVWDDERDEPIMEHLHNVDVKFVFDA